MYLYGLRYRLHRWMAFKNGIEPLPYDEWHGMIGYTVLEILTGFNLWKPWRWPILKWLHFKAFVYYAWKAITFNA